jgi:hypothetical protein
MAQFVQIKESVADHICIPLNLERKHDEQIKRPTNGEFEASSL